MRQILIELADDNAIETTIAKIKTFLGEKDRIVVGSTSEIIADFDQESYSDSCNDGYNLPSHLELYSHLSDLFTRIGLPANLLGYGYLQYAVELSLLNPNYLKRNVTKTLYPDIAKAFGTRPQRVERAIRHAITVAWDRGNIWTLNELFGDIVSPDRGKPTNSEFVARVVEMVKANIGFENEIGRK